MSSEPLVSICVPALNGARWVAAAVQSALAQTYETTEVLVVDNASTDETADIVRSFDDPRVRLVVNERGLGMVGNHNRCVELARGSLIKFLHVDDTLAPECVRKLVDCALDSDRVGLVFSRRSVVLDPEDPPSREWLSRYGTLHERFGPLAPVNSGRDVFERWLPGILAERDTENWIGEPSAVLLRRAALERVGLFGERMSQLMDVEMWLRVAFFFDVGFVDEELCKYRHHESSTTGRLAHTGQGWLDRLWLLEGLLAHPEIAAAHPELRRARGAESMWVARLLAGRVAHRRPLLLGSLRRYISFVAGRARVGLHPSLQPRST